MDSNGIGIIGGIVRPADGLQELAHQINVEHAAAENAAREQLQRYRSVGLALLKAKELCGHGQWLPWLKKNVRFSEQHARRYMAFAKSNTVSDLDAADEEWRSITGRAIHAETATWVVPDEIVRAVGGRSAAFGYNPPDEPEAILVEAFPVAADVRFVYVTSFAGREQIATRDAVLVADLGLHVHRHLSTIAPSLPPRPLLWGCVPDSAVEANPWVDRPSRPELSGWTCVNETARGV